MESPRCPRCEAFFVVDECFESATGYSSSTDSGSATCPACRQQIEFRVARNTLELGFTYWAGSLHFDAVASYRISRLSIERDRDAFVVKFGDLRFRIAEFPP